MALPMEFTPEINQAFLDKLKRPIKRRGVMDVGAARRESRARGLTGDPYESSAVGLAKLGTQEQLSDVESTMAYNLAGLGRQERLTGEGRQYQTGEREAGQQWRTGEAGLDRSLQERMAKYGYDWREKMMREQEEGGLFSDIGGLVGTGLGMWAGGPAGAKAGGYLGSKLGG